MGGTLLAVSGGIDSMTMARLYLDRGLDFAVAHCNFHLRGEESDGDADMVSGWCSSQGITFHKIDFDTLAYSREHGISIEMAARELRYGWFASLCRKYGYSTVAVAHNANDNVETLFLNLLRGTGLKGVAGMSKVDVLPYSGGEIRMERPLLDMTREEIESFAKKAGIPYREDRTNHDCTYKRNRLRNQVFPLLKEINPSFIRTVNRDMAYFSQAGEVLRDWAEDRSRGVATKVGKGIEIDIRALTGESHWEYLLYCILEPFGFKGSVLDSLTDLVSTWNDPNSDAGCMTSGGNGPLTHEKGKYTFSGKRFFSDKYILLTSSDKLMVRPADAGVPSVSGGLEDSVDSSREDCPSRKGYPSSELVVTGAGEYRFDGDVIRVTLGRYYHGMPLKQPAGTVLFDRKAVPFPFVIRHWREGDWMQPFGMHGRKKLSDIFTDMKYDLSRKEKAVIVAADRTTSHVLAVVGVRTDDSTKVTDATGETVTVTVI